MKTLTSAELIGAEPIERATWLFLLRFCAQQENGGIIKDCVSWSDRKWQQLCSVTQNEVSIESQLWEWHEKDIKVWAYPVDKEMEVKANRENGKKGGRPKRKNNDEPPKKPSDETQKKPSGLSETEPPEKPSGLKSVKRNTIEYNRIERNRIEERKGKENKPTYQLIYPKELDVEEFKNSFLAWLEWKKKSGDDYDELSLQSQFRVILQRLKVNSMEEIIYAIDTAIAGRWRNIRFDNLKYSKPIDNDEGKTEEELEWSRELLAPENYKS